MGLGLTSFAGERDVCSVLALGRSARELAHGRRQGSRHVGQVSSGRRQVPNIDHLFEEHPGGQKRTHHCYG